MHRALPLGYPLVAFGSFLSERNGNTSLGEPTHHDAQVPRVDLVGSNAWSFALALGSLQSSSSLFHFHFLRSQEEWKEDYTQVIGWIPPQMRSCCGIISLMCAWLIGRSCYLYSAIHFWRLFERKNICRFIIKLGVKSHFKAIVNRYQMMTLITYHPARLVKWQKLRKRVSQIQSFGLLSLLWGSCDKTLKFHTFSRSGVKGRRSSVMASCEYFCLTS